MLSKYVPTSWLRDTNARIAYNTLRAAESDEKLDTEQLNTPKSETDISGALRERLRRLRLAVILLSSSLVLVVLGWGLRELTGPRDVSVKSQFTDYVVKDTPEVFSPAIKATEWKEVVFHNNFEDKTRWQGPPNDEVDKAWRDLYIDIGVIKIPKEDAEKLPNQTLPIPGEEDGYIVGLEVYHQLHCLDLIRKHFYPERYGGDRDMTEQQRKEYWIHLEHCIDNLRQTIMCYSDISTIPWMYMERVHANFPSAKTTHICRDFDKLTEWMLHPDRHFPQEEYQLRLKALQAGALAESGKHP
ncbi:hypothetical protein B0H65DRAFT_567985 [Neurospora tetraspora]|uniref:Tat pathway signal sequence n=1 Tax=Neurospora tetraspora TaxID=94610 RepID=A0AAE0JK09_9PEZI|nr:hypothetical protein B0H65DRAFT_567985 [Neurospora tetraspora]